jgi:hypothetical protein
MIHRVLPIQGQPDLGDVRWHKSRQSNASGSCVETAFLADGSVAVRDTKDREGPNLIYTGPEWEAFIKGVKDGEFDLP